jgi:ribosomal protein S27AE
MPSLEPDALRLVERTLEELKRRGVKHDNCPRCEVFDWGVEPVAISVIPLQGVPARMPGSYFPSQIMAAHFVCKNCGYTMFHNLAALGLA